MSAADILDELDALDVCPEWEEVAAVLARQIVSQRGYAEALKQLEDDARNGATEAFDAIERDTEPKVGWEASYVAAQVLREADRRNPMARSLADGLRIQRELLRAQRDAIKAEQSEDPTRAVLVSPRLRQNVIERIVRTYGGRVRAEYLHETGWRRQGRMDLRVVMSGDPLPHVFANAISRTAGELDALAAEECLARFRDIDPHAYVGQPVSPPRAQAPDLFTSGAQFSENEILSHRAILEDAPVWERRAVNDPTNAELARAILDSTPALWDPVTLQVVVADEPGAGGYTMRLFGPDPKASWYRPRAHLRVLIARRYEAMEDAQGRAWQRMTVVVARDDLSRWRCDMTYEY